MRPSRLLLAATLGALLAAAPAADAQLVDKVVDATTNEVAAWSLSGSNTLRYDYYTIAGDQDSSPFSFRGPHAFNEFSLTATRRAGPYDLWRGQFFGLINESDYRSPEKGAVVERWSLLREKGDVAVPHRVEVGDFLAFFSLRTLQQSMKGLAIEIQPGFPDPDVNQSLVLVSGATQQSWADFNLEDDLTNGASYLIEHAKLGRATVNFVHNYRQDRFQTGQLERSQFVLSLAADRTFRHAWGQTTLETEMAGFVGDHDGRSGVGDGQGTDDVGAYAQLSGRGPGALTYRARYERYGQDFRPRGAIVTPDRQSIEGHLGYRLLQGLDVRTRVQHFRDGVETSNPTDTRTLGATVSGPLLLQLVPGLSGSVDAFATEVGNQDDTADSTTHVVTVNLAAPIAFGVTGRVGGSWQHADNHLDRSQDTMTWQTTAALDVPIRVLGLTGTVSPGVTYREVHNRRDRVSVGGSTDVTPTLALNVARGPHSLSADWTYAVLDRNPVTGGADVTTSSPHFVYRFSMPPHTLGLEFNADARDPRPGQRTDSFRVGAFYTYAFDKPALPLAAREPRRPAARRPGAVPTVELDELAPGLPLEEVMARLAAARIGGAVEQPGLIVYEVPLLPEISERQRLALLTSDDGKLASAALIVDIDDPRNPARVIETFERIRSTLLERYGRPSQVFDRGQVSPNLARDIGNGTFIRLTEWARPGGIVRLGIPRRLDGQIRVEVHFAPRFPPPGETLWGIERVR